MDFRRGKYLAQGYVNVIGYEKRYNIFKRNENSYLLILSLNCYEFERTKHATFRKRMFDLAGKKKP